MRTLDELRDNLMSTVRETQNADLFTTFINVTLQEIGQYAPWTWLRQRTTFDSVASQEFYNLDEEVDRIQVLRQISTPTRLLYVPDHIFYQYLPDPENQSTGTPRYYRLWEETSFSTQNTVAEALKVVSSSASDGSSFRVIVEGRESTNGKIVRESFTLNGTTVVTGTTTWAIGGLKRVSKSAQTTGTLTVSGATSSTTFSQLEPEERSPRFKRLGLYPIPASAVTFYLEYLERIRLLVNDADVPQMDTKWLWVLREGALAKSWEYKQNPALAAQHLALYQQGLERMRQQDQVNLDYIPVLRPRMVSAGDGVRRYADSLNDNYPVYGVG